MKFETGSENENDKRSTLAEAHAEDGNLCSCTYMQEVSGEQEEMAEHLQLDCDALAQVRFTVFGLVSKDTILKEDMAGCILGLWIFRQRKSNHHWDVQYALVANLIWNMTALRNRIIKML